MTHAATHQSDGTRRNAPDLTEFALPLVSVIIVNYNYGRFLWDAVSSVFGQNYKHVECFVVDNKSTDASASILEDLRVAYPALRIVRRGSNDGQCVAAAEIFPETKGQYIVFLDADDVLLPDFVGTHVYVSLSLYTHVGFTCSDMVQAVGDRIVLTTSLPAKHMPPHQKVAPPPLLRAMASSIWATDGLCPVVDGELQLVCRDERDWRWAATSAFMFRRDAIALLIDNPRLKTLRCALDVYFARGINAIAGSVLVDRALSIYRMHGSNIFSRHAHLDGCLNFDLGGPFDQNEAARRELIDLWFAKAAFMIKKFRIKEDFIGAILTLNDAPPRLTDARGRSYAAGRLLQHFATIRDIVGLPALLDWCVRLRVSPFALLSRAFTRRTRTPDV